MKTVYLDYNATTPVDPRVREALAEATERWWGNPSSSHRFGREARAALEAARAAVAEWIGAHPEEVIFTSGGTEGNNLALFGTAAARRNEGRRIVVSAVEHPSVMAPARALVERGFELRLLPVDRTGRVDLERAAAEIAPGTILVSVLHGQNEVGTLQPIRELAELAHRVGAWLHVDAAQSAGKVPVHVDELGADCLTLAGHKFYAPKGIGALYVRRGLRLAPLLLGAPQEGGRRPGTESVPLAVALGKAAALARAELEPTRLAALRDRLWAGLQKALPGVQRNGHPEAVLPNTLHVSFPGVDGHALVAALADRVACSAGSACHAGGKPSAVLAAMGLAPERARGAVRLSLGRFTTEEEVDRALADLVAAVAEAQRGS